MQMSHMNKGAKNSKQNIYKLTLATNKKTQQDTQIQDTHVNGGNIVFAGNNQLKVSVKDSYFQ